MQAGTNFLANIQHGQPDSTKILPPWPTDAAMPRKFISSLRRVHWKDLWVSDQNFTYSVENLLHCLGTPQNHTWYFGSVKSKAYDCGRNREGDRKLWYWCMWVPPSLPPSRLLGISWMPPHCVPPPLQFPIWWQVSCIAISCCVYDFGYLTLFCCHKNLHVLPILDRIGCKSHKEQFCLENLIDLCFLSLFSQRIFRRYSNLCVWYV